MIKNLELEPITIHFHTTEIFQLQLNKIKNFLLVKNHINKDLNFLSIVGTIH